MPPDIAKDIKKILKQNSGDVGIDYENRCLFLRQYLTDKFKDWSEDSPYLLCVAKDYYPSVDLYDNLTEAIKAMVNDYLQFWFEGTIGDVDNKLYLIPCNSGIEIARKDIILNIDEE